MDFLGDLRKELEATESNFKPLPKLVMPSPNYFDFKKFFLIGLLVIAVLFLWLAYSGKINLANIKCPDAPIIPACPNVSCPIVDIPACPSCPSQEIKCGNVNITSPPIIINLNNTG